MQTSPEGLPVAMWAELCYEGVIYRLEDTTTLDRHWLMRRLWWIVRQRPRSAIEWQHYVNESLLAVPFSEELRYNAATTELQKILQAS